MTDKTKIVYDPIVCTICGGALENVDEPKGKCKFCKTSWQVVEKPLTKTDKDKKRKAESPVREYRQIMIDGGGPGYMNRVMIGTATTGLIRMEWSQCRFGQIIPVNWSQISTVEFMDGYNPINYQVADAQNVIVKSAIERDFEWLLLYEHDVLPPPNAMLTINRYIAEERVPVVSGLYYTRSRPADPLVFRGRGDWVYKDWEVGDLVWCSGVPTGFLLIHMAILREMWKDSPEYAARNVITRRVFDTPRRSIYLPEKNIYNTFTGTSDLEWCNRVIEGEYFKKAGWKKYQKKEFPFLVDTNILCRHINQDGEQFP